LIAQAARSSRAHSGLSQQGETDRVYIQQPHLPPEQTAEFKRLEGELGAGTAEVLRKTVEQVIGLERKLHGNGLKGISHWVPNTDECPPVRVRGSARWPRAQNPANGVDVAWRLR
jgi:hypothetical protein